MKQEIAKTMDEMDSEFLFFRQLFFPGTVGGAQGIICSKIVSRKIVAYMLFVSIVYKETCMQILVIGEF